MNALSRKSVLQRSMITLLAVAFTLAAASAFASTQPYITDHQINFGTGNKYLQVTDVRAAGPGPRVSFTRTYNSQSNDTSILGHGWTTSFTEKLIIETGKIILVQSGGRYVHFPEESSDTWVNETGERRVITLVGVNYQLQEENGTLKTYDTAGKILSYADTNNNTRTYTYAGDVLASISNNFGAMLSFDFSGPEGKLSSITSPLGTYSYSYDTNGNLEIVTRPDTTTITYIYDDPNDIHNLTGIFNEENERILTVVYDSSDRAIQSSKQDGSNQVNINYLSTSQREVTNSVGITTTYELTTEKGVVRVASFAGPGCSSCGTTSDMSYIYDDRLLVLEATQAAGIADLETITTYTYDTNGNKLTKTEALGTAFEKTTTYTYYPDNKRHTIAVDSIANPGQQSITTMAYDTNGNLQTRTEAGYEGVTPISKTTTYSYNSIGQLTSVDGPRTDVTDIITMAYYPNSAAEGSNRGQLHTVTNSKNHVTTYSDYNIHGQAETITDANGLITTRVYNNRGHLTSSTTAGLTTSYAYNTTGDLQSVTRPGNRTISYGYDSAGRVNRITDNLGNSISYTFDSEGRKTAQEIYDPANSLVRAIDFEYDDSGRVNKVNFPDNASQSSTYNEVGDLVQTINATGLQTVMDYDLLRRLESLTEDTASTMYQYDANGNITLVTDANGKSTSFTYDDLGRRIERTAPDTGTTLYSYDIAGNLQTITDALNRSVGFTYDSLNRPISQNYGSRSIGFSYDQNTNGIGRLSSITDEHGPRSFLYNVLGQLTGETRLIGSTSYSTGYDYSATTGEMESITYPSSMVVQYNRGANGQVISVAIDDSTIISGVTHLPFGPLKAATLGTTPLVRDFDQRYNLSAITAGSLNTVYSRDAAGHVTSITNAFQPSAAAKAEDYVYDPANNQLTSTGTKSYTYDAVGNMLSDGTFTYTYDELNRITQVNSGATVVATYGYDSNSRRIVKTMGGTTIHYLYDASSNLIAETLADGSVLREYIYLDGEVIALQEYQNTPGLYYYINDHLGTPQQLIEADGTVVWQAAYLPFGLAQVNVETVTNNIRFPGQYFDTETGLHYNWHRFYDPTTGRYISADPIGLAGGMNLYAYVWNDPINRIDPFGLFGAGTENPGSMFPGHSDFPGHDLFDWNEEDRGVTNPFFPWATWRHFRPLESIEPDLRRAVNDCDFYSFRRLMHQGQDSFSHYDNGFRAWPFHGPRPENILPGHAGAGHKPDHDLDAWRDASRWTQTWLDEWNRNCPCPAVFRNPMNRQDHHDYGYDK